MSVTILDLLLDVSLRATVIAGLIAAALALLRVRAAAARHAAWTAVMAAMVTMPALTRVVPAWTMPFPAPTFAPAPPLVEAELRESGIAASRDAVAPHVAAPAGLPPTARSAAAVAVTYATERAIAWEAIAVSMYLVGAGLLSVRLMLGWWQASRIARKSRRIEAGGVDHLFESSVIRTPVVVGVFVPRIVLPAAHTTWPMATRRAVVAHEQAHIRRRDPLVAFLAQVTCSLFWFHPLAWWLRRTLAAAAEQACDEAALDAVGARQYAEVLLQMAATVHGRGRVAWEALGVGGNGGLGSRIARVLDGSEVPPPSRGRKASLALFCVASIAAVVACQQPPASVPPLKEDPEIAALLQRDRDRRQAIEDARRLTHEEVAALEVRWARNRGDLQTLERLLQYYGLWQYFPDRSRPIPPTIAKVVSRPAVSDVIAARRRLVLYLIEHAPQLATDQGHHTISPLGLMPDPEGHAAAARLWRAHAERPDASPHILRRAASHIAPSDPLRAEALLLRARAQFPQEDWTADLGRLYSRTIVASPASPAAERFRNVLETSTDAAVLGVVGNSLMSAVRPASGLVQADRQLKLQPRSPQEELTVALGMRYAERAVALDVDALTSRRLRGQLALRREHAQLLYVRVDGLGLPLPLMIPQQDRAAAMARLPEPERLRYLSRAAGTEYMRGEMREWNGRARLPEDAHDAAAARADGALWFDRSKQYATQALALATKLPNDPYRPVAEYVAHLTLGALAFRDGDRATALHHLRAAASVPRSERLAMLEFVPMESRLIDQLLKHGERQTVIEYLERSAALRDVERERLLKDAAAIRNGMMPEGYQRRLAAGHV